MSYDLYSPTTTGFHAALYSSDKQALSADNAVAQLLIRGVPANKIVVGSAFYSRSWQGVKDIDDGRYQAGSATTSFHYKDIKDQFSAEKGYLYGYDEKTQSAYVFNAEKAFFASFDDPQSLHAKMLYTKQKSLGGVMFWSLNGDTDQGELLNALFQAR